MYFLKCLFFTFKKSEKKFWKKKFLKKKCLKKKFLKKKFLKQKNFGKKSFGKRILKKKFWKKKIDFFFAFFSGLPKKFFLGAQSHVFLRGNNSPLGGHRALLNLFIWIALKWVYHKGPHFRFGKIFLPNFRFSKISHLFCF